MTEILLVDPADPDPFAIDRAAACLRRGGLVAFPTETVYGLGVHALDRVAVRRLFAAKERPPNDPLIVHVSTMSDAIPLVAAVSERATALAARFWPGPLTMVMKRSSAVPDEVTAGLDTVAIRSPAHAVARALLARAGIPVAAPSANLFSRPSPTSAAHVLEDLDGRIDMVVDAGATDVGIESTVVDLSQDVPTILRPGAVTLEMLRAVLPRVVQRVQQSHTGGPLPSPGMLSKHYAPRTPVLLFVGRGASPLKSLLENARSMSAAGKQVVVLAPCEDADVVRRESDLQPDRVRIVELGSRSSPSSMATRLYAALRECDAFGADFILATTVAAGDGLTSAIDDRLRRAAAQTVVIDGPAGESASSLD